MESRPVTVKLLSTCKAALTENDLGLTTQKNLYPGTAQKFPDKPKIIIGLLQDNVTPENEAVKNLNKFTIQPFFAQDTSDVLFKQGIKPLVVLFANANHPGGYGEMAKAQEENVLKDSNAPYAIPKKYDHGLILTYGGLFVISNATMKVKNKNVDVDFVFVAMPNLKDKNSSEFIYNKEREVYLRHVTSLIILQFHAAKNCGNVMVTGRQGCGVFGNKDEDIAAVIHAVANLPQFKDVKVVYALGSDRKYDDTYMNPPKNIIAQVNQCIQTLQKDIDKDLNIEAVSNNVRNKYGEKFAPELYQVMKCEEIHSKLNQNFKVKVVPYPPENELPRYQLIFNSENDAEEFSKFVFKDLGIAAKELPRKAKNVRDSNDLIFTSGQFDMLNYIGSNKIKNQTDSKLTENEKYMIKDYLDKFSRQYIKTKLDDEKHNAFSTMLDLDHDGFSKEYILSYVEKVYPDLSKTFVSSKSAAEELFNAVKEGKIPLDSQDPSVITLKQYEDKYTSLKFKDDNVITGLQKNFMADLHSVLNSTNPINDYQLNAIKKVVAEGQLMKQGVGFMQSSPAKILLDEYESNKANLSTYTNQSK